MAQKHDVSLSYRSYPKKHYLKEWREKRGWSQAELAQRIGCDATKISRCETQIYGISIEMQLALFRALDIMPQQFWWPPDTEWLDVKLWGASDATRREVNKAVDAILTSKPGKLSTEQ